MADIIILGTAQSWHCQRLEQAARSLGHRVAIVDYRRLLACLGPGESSLRANGAELLGADRVLVRSVPSGSLEQVVYRMDALHRLESAGVGVLNPPRAIEACVDKYLATARMQAAGLPVPRTIVCEELEQGLAAFAQLGGDVVIKPLFGSEGRGIIRVQDPAIAARVLRALLEIKAVLYLQEFIAHPGYDVRALVLGERVLAAMRRVSQGDFRTNVALGARVEPVDLPASWADLAVRAARAIEAPLAGIDLLPNAQGEPLVIEANSTPGFQALAQTTPLDIPQAIIEFLVTGRFGERRGTGTSSQAEMT